MRDADASVREVAGRAVARKPRARLIAINPKWFLALVPLVVAAAWGFNYLIEQSHYGPGPFVQFPARGGVPAIRFDLPDGWKIKYNGHHPTGQGSIVDPQGAPRIEVCWFRGSPKADPSAAFVETRALPVGDVAAYRSTTTSKTGPFSSIPLAVRGPAEIVDIEFLFDQGELMFTLRAEEEIALTPVVWRSMASLRYEEAR